MGGGASENVDCCRCAFAVNPGFAEGQLDVFVFAALDQLIELVEADCGAVRVGILLFMPKPPLDRVFEDPWKPPTVIGCSG